MYMFVSQLQSYFVLEKLGSNNGIKEKRFSTREHESV